jgi:hypothetical protein
VPTVAELPHQPFLDGPSGDVGFRWRLGLRPLDPGEWFDDGPDAAEWIAEKQVILVEHHDTAFAVLDDIHDEATEVAEAIVEHLGRGVEEEDRPTLSDGLHPLDAAARLVAEDLVLLVERDGRFVFGGGSVCFPNRWDLRSKLGLTLREVHEPVALLNEQLAAPVDRVLERLTPERGYWRLGWGVIDVPDGYTPADGSGMPRPADPQPGDLFVRVERETLRRFPRTNCVLFTIRTYVANIGDVARDPQVGERMATAIEVMPPAVHRYKDLAIVGEELVRFLRSAPDQR